MDDTTKTLQDILEHIHNWFVVDTIEDEFEVTGGSLSLPLMDGQYYRVVGSVFNDGLHKHPDYGMRDEVFSGHVMPMAVPTALVDLAEEVQRWRSDNYQAMSSPYQSESFGGYSYTRATSSSGGAYGWQDAFRSRLNAWRKLP